MRTFSVILTALAVSALSAAAPAQAAATRAAQSMPRGGGGNQVCEVRVRHNAAAGVFDVARQVLPNGRCICRVTTGPKNQGGSAADALASLLSTGNCADAPAVPAPGNGISGTGLVVGGLVVATGVAVGLSTGGNDSPGR